MKVFAGISADSTALSRLNDDVTFVLVSHDLPIAFSSILIFKLERDVMHKDSSAATDRRGFLRLGVLAGLACFEGCGGEPVTVTTPTLEKGNRKKLDLLQNKAAEGAKKQKKK
jgi:hypothetical protein